MKVQEKIDFLFGQFRRDKASHSAAIAVFIRTSLPCETPNLFLWGAPARLACLPAIASSGEAGGLGWRAGLSESNGGQVCGEYKSSPAVAA